MRLLGGLCALVQCTVSTILIVETAPPIALGLVHQRIPSQSNHPSAETWVLGRLAFLTVVCVQIARLIVRDCLHYPAVPGPHGNLATQNEKACATTLGSVRAQGATAQRFPSTRRSR
jgi:hypothetical protein